ncbi:LuxR C-terminal-related transcriptional regulator [Pedococcus bigeumensis]|uniref:Helix-turn-helix transcriptional regulator n=1 Tax=Pedococcus bigeumensis TaxID=433644 RepID=A0A502CQC5_9MICO|nr:LuxR family transcriptional regulator [Pedococcus bigeumensis]TPG14006.1 helix-turn-helix transcriptional regulator [Pedococcus bigeumensis]
MLVGREVEQRVIEQLLAGARVGDSGVLVISGDPGIGKTGLLAHTRARATAMRVLSARGVEAEREVTFGGLHQVCAPLLPLLDELPGPQAEALAVALAVRSGPTPARFAVGAAVLGLLTRAADEAPLAVVIDDGHLFDESSAQALAFAARRMVSDRIAVVVALRPDHESAFASLPTLHLGPLTVEGARTLLESAGPERWTQARLARFHEATGGNPLAILDLAGEAERLAAAPPDTPVALTGTLLAAYSRKALALSPEAGSALLLAATDNHDLAALARACQAAGVGLAALEEAEAAGLVRLTDSAVEFRHPLVRAAVYGEAGAGARREAHRLLAAAVEPGEVDRRAWHLAEAAVGPDDAAAALLDAAAEDAGRRGANAVASAQLVRSAAHTADAGLRGARLLRAGEQAWLAGATDHATGLLRQSLALAATPLDRALALGRLGSIEVRCGSLEKARDLLFAAAADAAPHDPDAAAVLLADAVEACFYLCDLASALRAAEQLTSLTGPLASLTARRVGRMAAGFALVLGGRADRGADLIRSAMAEPPDAGAESDQWRFRWALLGPMFLREAGEARAAMGDAVRTIRTVAAVGMLPFLLTLIARDHAGSDGWADAEAGYVEAIRLAQETGHDTDLALANAGLAWLLARQGRADESVLHGAEAVRLGTLHSAQLAMVWAAFAAADLEAATGRPEAAKEAYQALADQLAQLGVTDPDLSPGPELVECFRQLGEPGEAMTIADDFLAAARAKGQPWALARAHRALGVAHGLANGEADFLEAMRLHALTPDPFESARTRLAYGSVLRRSRRRVDARIPLREALVTFEHLGAAPWADRAAVELEATGETAQRRGVGVIAALTPQERQIATLLAQGRTSREAAVALFLSPKTVEYHLRHVYIKLGIHSREDLARVLAEG